MLPSVWEGSHQYLIGFAVDHPLFQIYAADAFAFAQPFEVHAGLRCCVAIDLSKCDSGQIAFSDLRLVMLLLDQIKPIEQLVPVS